MRWRHYVWIIVGLALIFVRGEAPTQAQPGVTWEGVYYNNIYLLGSPALIQSTGAVSYDWGAGSPSEAVNPDNFSVRWTTRTSLPAGTYRFFARADDAISVAVNFQTIIDTFDTNQAGVLVTQDITLGAGEHQIQVNYRELGGDAYAFLTWADAATNPTTPNFPISQGPAPTPSPTPGTGTITEPIDLDGWTAQYFGNEDLAGLPTAIFSEDDINFDWGEGAPVASLPPDGFSARWTTRATLQAGDYRITGEADDGFRVYVDGNEVIDAWDGDTAEQVSGDITLAAGEHNFVVEYREAVRGAYITLDVGRLVAGSGQATPPTPQPGNMLGVPTQTGATATVDAFRLNVRAAPTTDGRIVAKIERGETHPIVGRNADSSWWQIDVNGVQGWVFAPFIVDANSNNVPQTSNSSQAANVPGTGSFARATANVNLRSRPTRAGAVLGQLPRGAQAEITGRNSDGSWIQINYNGRLAWVSNSFVSTDIATSDIPLATE